VRLDAINRVYVFSQAHQAAIAGYVEAVKQMGELLTRANLLAVQVEAGEHEADGAVAKKNEQRRVIREDHLAHLVRIARVSLTEDPELRSRFRMPRRNLNQQEFVAAVRAILAEAAGRKPLFITEGMPESFVEELETLVTSYVQSVDQKSLGAASKVGARADLKAVTDDLMKLVRRLDGINRKRWQRDTEMLAAWKSAKDVSWPRVDAPAPSGGAADTNSGKETVA
jgi:hypothetical protein